jgi:hypothetical protein
MLSTTEQRRRHPRNNSAGEKKLDIPQHPE